MSCRYLYSILRDTHLQYRDIRSPLCKPVLWSRLARDDMRASLTRSLTILPENVFNDMQSVISDYLPMEERVPEEYRECSPVDNGRNSDVPRRREVLHGHEQNLIAALKRMTNLRQFRWFRMPPPVSEGKDDLWTMLNSLGTVEELHVLDLQDLKSSGWRSVVETPSFLSFQGLTFLDLRTDVADRAEDDPDLDPLLRMLVNCPRLKSLRVHLQLFSQVVAADAEILVQEGRWPQLTSLYLEGFSCQPDSLSAFLSHHEALRELRLSCMMPGYRWRDLSLPQGSLPNLCTLECHSPTAAALLRDPQVAPNLASLRGIDLSDTVRLNDYFLLDYEYDEPEFGEPDVHKERPSPWKAELLEAIRAHPRITSIEVDKKPTAAQIRELRQVAPQLKELSFCGEYDRKGEHLWHEARFHSPRLV
ncbi:hypothetical protein GLOTRDRAFT_141548 [Gloeophyllum trabeum ATCC 11539]|uniref:RNI-like protein n=1 Tax=Gloeophyllum trabeum (strain ATCC 11539 / FP-39264 / Madison 617) TaxID=670483 RepID=S7R7L3_GLOTA|nr:uncharacterized protein GLOTRDRAFT_141548 [Gloeophyllum trabeum ATCC 11539]EPQ50365.1 hypothetical protein GLOTRDRAFT_141548 [Gloeophyllum trabeum ATCC 11539]